MDLNHARHDAMIEIANVGISKAARQLSDLLNDAIRMDVPDAQLVDLASISKILHALSDEDIAWVYQRMDGKVAGMTVLLFNTEESRNVVRALIGTVSEMGGVDLLAYEHEAMMEIGNIIISSCVGAIADMVGTEIILSVPTYIEGDFQNWLKEQWPSNDSGEKGLVVLKTQLSADKRKVNGTLNLIFTVDSVHELLNQLDVVLNRNTSY